ncbi:MAG: hypothetical protein N2485_08460, partial [bacterium]|nr:hypothetical protein [bacterium]
FYRCNSSPTYRGGSLLANIMIKIHYNIFLIQAVALGKNEKIINDIKKEMGENILLNTWIKRIEGATA